MAATAKMQPDRRDSHIRVASSAVADLHGHAPPARDLGRERVSEIQRARILAAMGDECAARGIGNVTVAHVVARAGVSRRTFYELFSDCEDCFIGAFDEGIARAAREVLGAYDQDAKWVDRVRAGLVAWEVFSRSCYGAHNPQSGTARSLGPNGSVCRPV